MIFFLLAVLSYVGALVLIKPAPASLKAKPISYVENFKLVWVSVFFGVFLLICFLLITNLTFTSVDNGLYGRFSLSNTWVGFSANPIQIITHLFIHANVFHLIGNVSVLALVSVYERRVGAKRFIAVLLIASIASIPSVFFYSEPVLISGISGGIFGLAAAYFTDEKDLSTKDWVLAICAFLFLVLLFAIDAVLQGEANATSVIGQDLKVDHIGHFLGALGAILYCRFRPLASRA